MATELRKTGVSGVGDMPCGAHFWHFYETKQGLLDTQVPPIRRRRAGPLKSSTLCRPITLQQDGKGNGRSLKVRATTSRRRNRESRLTIEIKKMPRLLIFALALVSSTAVAQTAVET